MVSVDVKHHVCFFTSLTVLWNGGMEGRRERWLFYGLLPLPLYRDAVIIVHKTLSVCRPGNIKKAD